MESHPASNETDKVSWKDMNPEQKRQYKKNKQQERR